jgi:large repetitive protein
MVRMLNILSLHALLFFCVAFLISFQRAEGTQAYKAFPSKGYLSRCYNWHQRRPFIQSRDEIEAILPGQVSKDGHTIEFGQVGSHSASRIYLGLTFQGRNRFIPSQMILSVNGAYPQYPRRGRIHYMSRWQRLNSGSWVLVIDLSAMRFSGGRGIARVLADLQKNAGSLKIGVKDYSKISSAQLYFVHKSDQRDERPVVVLDSVEPSGKQIASQSVSFQFHTEPADAKVQCSLDNGRFAACSSPMSYNQLKTGQHRFSARAISPSGWVGHAKHYNFKVLPGQAAVKIQNISPNSSPTSSSSLSVSFSVSGKSLEALCQLDSMAPLTCKSPWVIQGIGQGAHSLKITSKAGGVPATYAWVVDQSAPEIEWLETPPELSRENIASFKFQANEVASSQCSLDGGSFSQCEESVRLSSLSDGAHNFSVIAIDSAGNRSQKKTFLWTIDTSAPELTLLGVSPQQNVTNSQDISVSFGASEQALFRCSLDGGDEVSCSSPFEASGLLEGSHSLVMRGIDIAGNESASLRYDWAIDLSGPSLSLRLVSPGSLPTNQRDAEISLITDDADASFLCSLNGLSIGCANPLVLSNLSEGLQRVEVVQIDAAGNQSHPVSLEWMIDLSAPTVSILSVVPSAAITSSNFLELSFDVSESALVSCEVDQGGEKPCSSPLQLNELADGLHSVILRAQDAAGNDSQVVSYSWQVLNRVAAHLDSVTPAVSPTRERNISFQFSSSTGWGFRCSLDDSSFSNCQSPMSYNNLADGPHRFEVRAVDSQGLMSEGDSYDWQIDASAPQAQLVSVEPSSNITASRQISIGFQANELGSFLCSLDGSALSACSSPFSASGLSDGAHSFSVKAVDLVGNEGAIVSYQWTVDTLAPVVTITGVNPSHSPTANQNLTIQFSANEVSSFSCSVDGNVAIPCVSPYTVNNMALGSHSINIFARDAAGNLSAPASHSWVVDTTALVISNVAVTQITRTSALITWTTNIPSSSQVIYGEGSALDQSTVVDPTPRTAHSVQLSNLRAFTVHSFRAKSVDADVREILSDTLTFRTLR